MLTSGWWMMIDTEYRDRCFDKKAEECEICAAVDAIVVHHIDGNRHNNSLGNLMPVCCSCHGKIHSGSEELKQWSEKIPDTGRTDLPVNAVIGEHRIDCEIIDELTEGARTQGYLVDKTGRSRNQIHTRLNLLAAAEFIENVHENTSLWELKEDPRDR